MARLSRMRPIRVTAVSHNLNREGAPLVLLELIRGLTEAGIIEPTVLGMLEGPLRAEYQRLGIAVRVLDPRRRGLRAALHLAHRRTEVVLANTVLAFWAVDVARAMWRKSMWIIHESEPGFALLYSPNERKRARRALARADRVIFPSHATRAVYRDLETRQNFSVFHNGFDRTAYEVRVAGRSRAAIRARLGIEDGVIAGVLVGTVSERKSQLDAVRAVAALPSEVARRLAIFVVGDVPGEYSASLHTAAKVLPTNAIRIIPYADDIVDYYLAADFALSTSRMEAFPKVVQEAMYFGLPLVVAPVFGIAEQVEDEKSALFFPAGDVAALANRLERIACDAALRQRLGQGARAALERLPSMDDMIEQYGRWLRECVGR